MYKNYIFSKSPNKRGYMKIINLLFWFLKFCSRMQKYPVKRDTAKYSMYSVILRGINRPPKCTKLIFLNSPNIRGQIKLINLLFSLINICLRKEKINGETKNFQVYYVFCHPEG